MTDDYQSLIADRDYIRNKLRCVERERDQWMKCAEKLAFVFDGVDLDTMDGVIKAAILRREAMEEFRKLKEGK